MKTSRKEINKAELHGYTVTIYFKESTYRLELIEPLYKSEIILGTIDQAYSKFLEVLDWLESKPTL